MTCESKEFCKTHFWVLQALVKDQTGCPVGPQGRRLAQALP